MQFMTTNKTIISIRIKRFLIMLEKIGNIVYNIGINMKEGLVYER